VRRGSAVVFGAALALAFASSASASPAECVWSRLSMADQEAAFASPAGFPPTRTGAALSAARQCGIDEGYGPALAEFHTRQLKALTTIADRGGPDASAILQFVTEREAKLSQEDLLLSTIEFAQDALRKKHSSNLPAYELGRREGALMMPIAGFLSARRVLLDLEIQSAR
jgi:hypothetical protein